jgi:hypothetical protein
MPIYGDSVRLAKRFQSKLRQGVGMVENDVFSLWGKLSPSRWTVARLSGYSKRIASWERRGFWLQLSGCRTSYRSS